MAVMACHGIVIRASRFGRSCVLSVSSEGDSEDGQWSAWVVGVAERGGKVDRPSAGQRADGEVAQAGHDLWTGAGAQPGGVLGEGHVADPVQPFSIAQCPRR